MKLYINLLEHYGFQPAGQKEDFGYVIPYVHYALRKRGNIHEYVSLVSYEGEFVEAVYELFIDQKNPYKKGKLKSSEMAKRGFNGVFYALARSFSDLENLVRKTDTETKELADRLVAQLLQAEKAKP